MFRAIKKTALETLRGVGAFDAVSRSDWRRSRLLVLCYHGISLEDEHEWNGGLYIPQSLFERRMRFLRENHYRILSLEEGLERVKRGDLPERSIAVTFDDGMYDFYEKAWPVVRRYDVPVTVYLTTYHCDFNRPIFRLTCSYVLWKMRGSKLDGRGLAGLPAETSLASAETRHQAVFALDGYCKTNDMTGRDKDALLAELAGRLGFDYQALLARRMLHIMNPAEVQELAAGGADFQLHTHRHRTPVDAGLFRREIEDNDRRLQELTGRKAAHFCYPSGVYHSQFVPWLKELGVASATTCEAGFVTANSNSHLLPRMLDHMGVSDVEFEGWLTGLRAFLPSRKIVTRDPDLMAETYAGSRGRES